MLEEKARTRTCPTCGGVGSSCDNGKPTPCRTCAGIGGVVEVSNVEPAGKEQASAQAQEQQPTHDVTFVDPWARPPGFWKRDAVTDNPLVWRPRLWWDTYESWRDEWTLPVPEEAFTRLFVDPFHGEKFHDPAKTWFDSPTHNTHRAAILRMKVVLIGDAGLVDMLRHQARFMFDIGCMEFACAVLGDIENWYKFSPALYIPPHQSFDGRLQVRADVAQAVDSSPKKVSVRVTFDIREGREVEP